MKTLSSLKPFYALMVLILFGTVLICPALAGASEMDDLEAGFDNDDEPVIILDQTDDKSLLHPYRLSGWAKVSLAYDYSQDTPANLPPPEGTDHGGISRVRPEFFLEFDGKFLPRWKVLLGGRYRHDFVIELNDRDDYAQQYIDDVEDDFEVWEAYIQGEIFPGFDIKAGRQIIIWGTSDDLRVTDVINPLDYREFGMTDIEGLRLPLGMVRLDWTTGNWTTTGLALFENRASHYPVIGSPYAADDMTILPDDQPADSWENMGFGLAIQGKLTGWDIAFYYADYFDHTPYVRQIDTKTVLVTLPVCQNVVPAPGFPPQLVCMNVDVPFEIPTYGYDYARLQMVGTAFNVAIDNWLIKAEAAYKSGYRYFNLPDETKDKMEGLLGLDYNGFSDTTISVETSVSHIMDYDEEMRESPDFVLEDLFTHALRIQTNWMNDTLHTVLVGTLVGETGGEGWFARGQVEYDWFDAFSTTFGAVVYGTGDSPTFKTIDDNDRIFLEAKYNF